MSSTVPKEYFLAQRIVQLTVAVLTTSQLRRFEATIY